MNRVLNLARFVDSFLTSSGLLLYSRADPPCFPVFLLTKISTQFLFRESCADSVSYKHNSLFFFIFWLFLLYFSVRARIDHVSLNSANQRKRTVRFFNPVIRPRISCMQSRNSEGYLGIPPPAHTFNLESRHDFALKSRIPSSK